MMRTITSLLLLLLMVFGLRLEAQESNARFVRFGVADGLPSATISDICQDAQGFLWVATEDGLCRFDGYSFKVYRNIPGDATSLIDDGTRWIRPTPEGHLWIGTRDGVCRFDPVTEQFTDYAHWINDSARVFDTSIWSLLPGSKRQVWIGGYGCLNRLDLQSNALTQHFAQANPERNRVNSIMAMHEDRNGRLWVGTFGTGLYRFDPSSNTFHAFELPTGEVRAGWYAIFDITQDRHGYLWVVSNEGIYRISPDYLQVERIEPLPGQSSMHYTRVLEDAEGNIWFGGRRGLVRFRHNTAQHVHFKHQPTQLSSLCSDNVEAVYQDRGGNLWIGTDHGLCMLPSNYEVFERYLHVPDAPVTLSSNQIYSLAADKTGSVWIGTDVGLDQLPQNASEIKHYQLDIGDNATLPGKSVHGLAVDDQNRLWVGTNGNLGLLEPGAEDFISSRTLPKQTFVPPRTGCQSLLVTANSRIWVGTGSEGAYSFPAADFTTGAAIDHLAYVPDNPELLSSGLIHSLAESTQGDIWLGTNEGISVFKPETGALQTFHITTNNTPTDHGLNNREINSILEDASGTVWVATNGGGLNKWNPESSRFSAIREADGLSNDAVFAVLEDQGGNLWLSTNKGLDRYNPTTGTVHYYDAGDGLPEGGFYRGAACSDPDGNLYFGGSGGMVRFHPDSVRSNTHVPEVVFTNLLLFNESVDIADSTILLQSLQHTDHLTLNYDDYIFALEFSALSYREPQKNQFAYKLEGLDNDWIFTGPNNRRAVYTNLEPGDYTLVVKASNDDGLWNETGTRLQITVRPPWWQQPWLRVLWFLSVIAGVYLLYRVRVNALTKRQRELEALVSERTQEIAEQNTLLEQQAQDLKALDDLKSRFFANISHELRTPLTLILGPVKNVLNGFEEKSADKVKSVLKVVKRNGQNLLHLVEEILDLSKLQASKLQLQERPVHLAPFIERVFSNYLSQASYLGIDLDLDKAVDADLWVLADQNKLEKVVNNLVSNALKFTPKGGTVQVSVFGLSEVIRVVVKDNGRGIHPNDSPHIFERFYQSSLPDAAVQGGTGIGLALSKELAELMKGTLRVESELGIGSSFVFEFPQKTVAPPLVAETPELELANEGEEDEEYAAIPPPQGDARETVLIVEDTADMQAYIESLVSERYRVQTATNGQEALALLESGSHQIDLIVSDVMMPQMDGFTLLTHLKDEEQWQGIPVIMLTARAAAEDKLQALTIGVDDYLTKPFSAEELMVRIANLLANYRQRKAVLLETEQQPEPLSPLEESVAQASAFDAKWIKELEAKMKAQIGNNAYKLTDAADDMHMSFRQLQRRVKQVTGLTPIKLQREIRLQMAREALESGDFQTVSEVSYSVGFTNTHHFSKLYEERYGRKPSEY